MTPFAHEKKPRQAIVTGSFTITFDLDEFDTVESCVETVVQDWEFYATAPDTITVEGQVLE
jgi:hypothetical protein